MGIVEAAKRGLQSAYMNSDIKNEDALGLYRALYDNSFASFMKKRGEDFIEEFFRDSYATMHERQEHILEALALFERIEKSHVTEKVNYIDYLVVWDYSSRGGRFYWGLCREYIYHIEVFRGY